MQGGPLDAQHIRGENKKHDTQLADQPLAGCKNRGIAVCLGPISRADFAAMAN